MRRVTERTREMTRRILRKLRCETRVPASRQLTDEEAFWLLVFTDELLEG